jgi:hypothetical protein
MARVSGFVEREREFNRLLQECLVGGDMAKLASVVKRFNDRARVSSPRWVLRPFTPMRFAVGN